MQKQEYTEEFVKEANQGYTQEKLSNLLYNADPKCQHVLDPNCWSGIRCLKCRGWYCL